MPIDTEQLPEPLDVLVDALAAPVLALELLLLELLLLLLLPQPAATSAESASATRVILPFTAVDLLLGGRVT